MLTLPRSSRIHPTFHISRVKPVHVSTLVPSAEPPPPPRFVNGEPVYTVKCLLMVRQRAKGLQYLVHWEGYGPEEQSWVSSKDILDPKLIREHPQDSGPSGVGRGGDTVITC